MSDHGHALFPLPNPFKTIVTDEANSSSDNNIFVKGDDKDDNMRPSLKVGMPQVPPVEMSFHPPTLHS